MAIISARNSYLAVCYLFAQTFATIHGATLIPRVPATPVYAMNPGAAAFHDSCLAQTPKNNLETKQDFIQRAWAGALEMVAAAQERFTNTRGFLGDDGEEPTDYERTRSIIQGYDPGYVQFFKMDWSKSTVFFLRQVWSFLMSSINVRPGEGGRPANNQIVIICGPVDNSALSWEDACRDTPQGKVVAGTRSIKDQNSNTLYICDTYFERDRFDLFKAATEPNAAPDQNGVTAAVFHKVRQLEGEQGTDAKTLIHEWTHLWFIGPTNEIINKVTQQPPEVYGWYECANMAEDHKFGESEGDFVKNADSFAWYAEYWYFKDRLGADHWPNQCPHEEPVQY